MAEIGSNQSLAARKRRITASALSRRAAIFALAATAATPSLARGQSAVIKMAGVPEDSITAALIAEDNGIFKKSGLTVELAAERSGSAIASGVAGGAFQIAKSSLVGLIVARSKGIPFVLVAPGGVYDPKAPITALLVKSDGPIKTASDLNGKNVAVSAINDLNALATKEWMEKNGAQPDSIKQLEFPNSAVPDALIAGRIDAGCVVEPIVQRALDTGKIRALARPFDAIAPQFLYSGWFALESWTAQNSKDVMAFARAMREASTFANAHRDQTIPSLARFTGLEPALIGRMTRVAWGTTLDPKLIQPVINACAKYKLIAAPFDAKEMIAAPLRG